MFAEATSMRFILTTKKRQRVFHVQQDYTLHFSLLLMQSDDRQRYLIFLSFFYCSVNNLTTCILVLGHQNTATTMNSAKRKLNILY